MLKLKDAVTTDPRQGYGYVGDIQILKVDRDGDGLALVRRMGSQACRWHRISDLTPLDWLND